MLQINPYKMFFMDDIETLSQDYEKMSFIVWYKMVYLCSSI